MQHALRSVLLGAGASILAALAVAAPALAAEVRVTVAEYSSKTGPYFEDAAKAFEAANPGTDIKIEVVPWDVLQQKLTTDISGNANADLAIIGTRWLVDFVQQGVVTPLDSYMNDAFKARFIPTFFAPGVLDGKTYGLPIASSARAMYYNKELFEKAGIAAPPATWDELVADATKIKALGLKDTYGFGLQGKEIETDVYFYYAMWSFGGDIVGADGKSGVDSPAAVKAATLYKQMIDDGLTEPGVTAYNREDVQNLFKQGRIGMMFTAPFLASQIKTEAPNLQYGVAPVPKGTTSATYAVTDSIVMFDNSKVKDEAWKFLDFLFQNDWREKFTVNEGFLTENQAVAKLPYFADDPNLKVFTAMLPSAKFAPTIAGWEEIADATGRAMQKIYLGEAKPEEALKAAADQANGVLGAK
ncbi:MULTISPECIES: ABC transporter substrate-binding protein [Inquilinus]|uniref:Multiple sugar transport system substrate-binding protein n=1 Tax=Inquilinus ginsengisoli TaxID=363840 RepID=A0ABU1JS01_9PROT|nr:sugar ABC transporter substrate-binding protein [Inquilinus ginsengisoli]MDR6291378.1 multiple sugar transport system substrate-binding protein [Inquilinus ginsengisoli]